MLKEPSYNFYAAGFFLLIDKKTNKTREPETQILLANKSVGKMTLRSPSGAVSDLDENTSFHSISLCCVKKVCVI